MTHSPIHSLLDAIPLPALLVAADSRLVGANDAAAELVTYGALGRHFNTALRQPGLTAAIERCLGDRGTHTARFLARQGVTEVTYRVRCAWVECGEINGVLASFTDLSDVESAGQMRRDFVANVSHELRTPLTALIGFIETLQGPAREDPKAQGRFLGIMANEAGRMERLVRDLLSLSRVEAHARVRPRDPVDLGLLLRGTLDRFEGLARETGATLEVSMPDGGQTVPGDADQLAQVLSNLIENAIKYGGANTNVQVTLDRVDHDRRLRESAVRLRVRDDGPGIEGVHLARLTERFYRVDTHRSREMGGTGLGLAIVKHIVNRHRGHLRVHSTPGEGSTFTVVLPVQS